MTIRRVLMIAVVAVSCMATMACTMGCTPPSTPGGSRTTL